MRALILKEMREGWNVVLFGGALSILAMGLYALSSVHFRDTELGADVCQALLAILPPVIAVVAGSSLVAREKAKGTLPLLLALPLSRGRIWGAKAAGGLVLAVLASLLFSIPVALVVPLRETELGRLAPYWCVALWWAIGFGLALLCSSLAERPFHALLVAVVVAGGVMGGAAWVVAVWGGKLFGYSAFLDTSLWALLTVPATLLGSALAVKRGELLWGGRKWAVAIPAVVVSFGFLFALTAGVARWATRYERSEVTAITRPTLRPGGSVVAFTAAGFPVPDTADTRRFQTAGSYRRNHRVVLGLETGRELLVERAGGPEWLPIAVSPSNRQAAMITHPAPLTCTTGGSVHPMRLEVWDLEDRHLRYRGRPQYEIAPLKSGEYGELLSVSWSPDGEWLAVGVQGGWPEGVPGGVTGFSLLMMRPDGGDGAATPALAGPDPGETEGSLPWDWHGDAVYLLNEHAKLVRWSPGNGRKETVWHPNSAPSRSWWSKGGVRVSPDGKWVAVGLVSAVTQQTEKIGRWQVAVTAVDGSRATVVWEASGSASGWGMQLVWSPDSRRLYFVDSEKVQSPLGRVPPARLVCWEVGSEAARPVEGTGALHYPGLTILPETGELLVRKGDTGDLVTVDSRGRVSEFGDKRIREAMRTASFLGLDADGRAVLYGYRPRSLSTLDLRTGKLKRIYP